MTQVQYGYSATPTKNPFRFALALWNFMTRETTDQNVGEVGIIEIAFARSRLGRRLARWDRTIDHLSRDERTRQRIRECVPAPPISLEVLESCPSGSLGQVFAEHCRNRNINPNLIDIPLEHESDRVLQHLFQTHDIWHVLTGWGMDNVGEVGLGGFYCGQMGSPVFSFSCFPSFS